jgi:hypothetical protein
MKQQIKDNETMTLTIELTWHFWYLSVLFATISAYFWYRQPVTSSRIFSFDFRGLVYGVFFGAAALGSFIGHFI